MNKTQKNIIDGFYDGVIITVISFIIGRIFINCHQSGFFFNIPSKIICIAFIFILLLLWIKIFIKYNQEIKKSITYINK